MPVETSPTQGESSYNPSTLNQQPGSLQCQRQCQWLLVSGTWETGFSAFNGSCSLHNFLLYDAPLPVGFLGNFTGFHIMWRENGHFVKWFLPGNNIHFLTTHHQDYAWASFKYSIFIAFSDIDNRDSNYITQRFCNKYHCVVYYGHRNGFFLSQTPKTMTICAISSAFAYLLKQT